MGPSPPGSGVPPPRGLPRGGGTPGPSDPGEIPIIDTDPDPGVFGEAGDARLPALPRAPPSLQRSTGKGRAHAHFFVSTFCEGFIGRKFPVAGNSSALSAAGKWERARAGVPLRSLLSRGPAAAGRRRGVRGPSVPPPVPLPPPLRPFNPFPPPVPCVPSDSPGSLPPGEPLTFSPAGKLSGF